MKKYSKQRSEVTKNVFLRHDFIPVSISVLFYLMCLSSCTNFRIHFKLSNCSEDFNFKRGCKLRFYRSVCDLEASADLDYTRRGDI